MVPYLSGIRKLDCLYLDTTFASVKDYTLDFPDRVMQSHQFTDARASSLQELVGAMQKYPKSTVFHFNAWTLGYYDIYQELTSKVRRSLGRCCVIVWMQSRSSDLTGLILDTC